MPDKITWFEIFTLTALIAGPVIAVIIARSMDTSRAKRERRMDRYSLPRNVEENNEAIDEHT